jgi:flagellar FliL protein
MICESCNKEIENDSKFCTYCGYEIKENEYGDVKKDSLSINEKSNKKIIFGAKYSRLIYWIISIILFFISSFFFGVGNQLERENAIGAAAISFGISFLISLIWINTLSNRIRDYGGNPWFALFALIPLMNLILGIYYGIENKKNQSIENNNNSNSKGKLITALIVIALILSFILLIIVGIWNYKSKIDTVQPEEYKENYDKKYGTYKAYVNDIVLVLTDLRGREKLMKLSFSIESDEPKIEAIVEEYKSEIIDMVISQVSARTVEELLIVEGKELLNEELKYEINNLINENRTKNDEYNVKKIIFTTFIIK